MEIGIVMSGVSLRSVCVGLALFLSTNCVMATSHVFVRTEEGVWLASDSFTVHNDGTNITASNGCKVVISRGRFLFNAGQFGDVRLLMAQEAQLPFASMEQTIKSLATLLRNNHMDLRLDPKYSLDLMVVNTGIVQAQDGAFQAHMIGQTDDLRVQDDFIKAFTIGIPHGYGKAVDRVREEAAHDPAVAARIAKNPKEELLKILQEEAESPGDGVGAPFTVLLLHNDGTISDFSDEPLCSIPLHARHVEESKPAIAPAPSRK